ncbi:MAG: hypothetical protein J5792_02985, partial [Bacteroidales bacterium]|nr:hypothetical protein [Bacteroidales bacterium]
MRKNNIDKKGEKGFRNPKEESYIPTNWQTRIVLKRPILFLASALLLAGCAAMYGYRPLKSFEQKKCDRFAKSIDRHTVSICPIIGDSVQFAVYRNLSSDSLWRDWRLVQPMQILYFANDSLVSFHRNCTARGKLFSLDWNFDNRFGEFPPKTAVPLEDNGLSYRKLQQIYQLPESLNTEYQIVIFWTNMFRRISKDAVN